jgi:hypothetical protein
MAAAAAREGIGQIVSVQIGVAPLPDTRPFMNPLIACLDTQCRQFFG